MTKQLKRFRVEIHDHIAEVVLNQPKRYNAMDMIFFEELHSIFSQLDQDPNVRVVIMWSEGKLFSSGLDLKASSVMLGGKDKSVADKVKLMNTIERLQNCISSVKKCKKPVIAAIQGLCIGGAVDLITACDIRVCTKDAKFSIRETKVAIVADVGTLQRITKIVGKGFAREMAFTGDDFDASTCNKWGLVNKVFGTQEEMLEGAKQMAKTIAKNSPLVVQGTKRVMDYSDEHTEEEGLQFVKLWNTAFLKSEDLQEAFMSFIQKRKPIFKASL